MFKKLLSLISRISFFARRSEKQKSEIKELNSIKKCAGKLQLELVDIINNLEKLKKLIKSAAQDVCEK